MNKSTAHANPSDERNVMLELTESYNRIRKSIVAICIRDSSGGLTRNADPTKLPEIIGTGFIVRSDGLIATNDHVVKAAIDHIDKGHKVGAIILAELSFGITALVVGVMGCTLLKESPIRDAFQDGTFVPDLGFLRVSFRNLPIVTLNEDTSLIEEGTEVATSGFPFGAKFSMLNKSVGPVLQKGIVSSVFPFKGSALHGFAINVMNHPGSSGSPVFLPSSSSVIGILYGGLNIASNFSFVVPARYIVACLSLDLSQVGVEPFDESVQDFLVYMQEVEKRERPIYEEALRASRQK